MKSKKKVIVSLSAVLLTVIFICFPFPAADLHIRIFFDEIQGEKCALYYTTDTSEYLSEDKCSVSWIDGRKAADFRLDAVNAGHIANLRIDWPDQDQVLCIRSVEISSAGIIQKEFDPCMFFDPSNIAAQNGIKQLDLVRSRKRAYIVTEENDPNMLLSLNLVNRIQKCYSHYRLTRLAVCLFFWGCVLSWKKGLFSVSLQEGV